MAVLAPLAAVWVAAGIVDDITGAIGGLFSKPVDFAKELVRRAVDFLSDWIDRIVGWVDDIAASLGGAITALREWAGTVSGWVITQVDRLRDRLVGWAGDLTRPLFQFRDWVWGTFTRWVQGMIDQLWGWAGGVTDWVTRNVWDPLWARISGVFDWVQTSVLPWVAGMVDALHVRVSGVFDWVAREIGERIRGVVDWVRGPVGLVLQAWDWLTFIVRYPFDWVVRTVRDVAHASPATVTSWVVDSFARDGGRSEEFLVRWLG